jgi:uncharacterized protein YndB with AHSA1/START domain
MRHLQEHERAIRGEVVVDGSLQEVWAAWTTEEGVKSFFAPACRIDLRPDEPYEIFFNPTAEPGLRGGEGLRVLAVQEPRMLSFTWNAPPSLPEVRPQRTVVILRLSQAGPGRTRVVLTHAGWGEGGQWDEAFDYFEGAWKKVVLARLAYRFDQGPVDWDRPPDLVPYHERVV